MSISLVKIPRATAADAGCWIDGHWGQYGTARLVSIAAEYGYSGPVVDIAERHLASMGPYRPECPGITDDEFEALVYGADDAEEWLNDYVAPAGYSFGWFEGEFFLWRDACEFCGSSDYPDCFAECVCECHDESAVGRW